VHTKMKLRRAETLINGLYSEKERWLEEIQNLTKINDTIVGDVLLSSGIISYLSAFTFDYRQVI
jgi:dynein heavy chain, axonemal